MTTAVRPSQMAVEMAQQPAALRRIVARREELRARISERVPVDLQGTALVGRGSSAHAAAFGRVLVELATSRPAFLVSPSMWRLYDPGTDYRRHLAIGLSQSGRTPDVVAALRSMSARGAAAIALTADPSSPLASAAALCLDLDVGTELAVPTTKAFTAQLAVLVVLAEALGGTPLPDSCWQRAGEALQRVVDDPEPALALAERLDGVAHLSVIGSGAFDGVAAEVALKLREAALVAADAFSAAEHRHGPVAVAGSEHPVIAVLAPGAPGHETRTAVDDLRAQGVPVLVIGAGGDLDVPADDVGPLSALPLVVRGQQLALALALRRGLDPDHPNHLSKVTST